MADAEDLKSSGDFSSCGFDSHPGHQYVSTILREVTTVTTDASLSSYGNSLAPDRFCSLSVIVEFRFKNSRRGIDHPIADLSPF